MRETLKLTFALTLISALCATLLAAVYRGTAPARAHAAEAKRNAAAAAVLPKNAPAPVAVATMAPDGGAVTNLACFDAEGRLVAAAVVGRSTHGYAGEITLMVGIDAKTGHVVDFAVLSASETPGLGAKIAEEEFRKGVRDRPVSANWTVRKDGGEVDGVTSATISSRAALEAIRDALATFAEIAKLPPPARQ